MLKAEAKSSGLGIALLVLSVRCCSAATFGFVRGELIVFLSFSFFKSYGRPRGLLLVLSVCACTSLFDLVLYLLHYPLPYDS